MGWLWSEYRDLRPLYRAWAAHYLAKFPGIPRHKAESLAHSRVRRKRTWPPAVCPASE
jgi:hypothetical protein